MVSAYVANGAAHPVGKKKKKQEDSKKYNRIYNAPQKERVSLIRRGNAKNVDGTISDEILGGGVCELTVGFFVIPTARQLGTRRGLADEIPGGKKCGGEGEREVKKNCSTKRF